MIKRSIATAFAAVLVVGAANAADLGVRKPANPAVPMMAAYNWTGFYVGIQGGYQWGRTKNDFFTPGGVFIPGASGASNPNGVIIGAHAGYNHQLGNNLVLGVEGDIEWTGYRGNFTFVNGDNYRAKADLQGSVRGRVGYAIDRVMIYATGGLAFSNLHNSAFNFATATRVGRTVGLGWTVGGGVEYAINRNWSARVEYRYTQFARNSYNPAPAFAGTVRASNNSHAIRAGVSYKF